MDKSAWNPAQWNPSQWFSTTPREDDSAKITNPGFGKGALAAPKAAPAIPVQSAAIPVPVQNAVPSMAGAPKTSAKSEDKAKVAILLPLTGANAALGQSMLNAAQMAVFDVAPDNFELMPRDTAAKIGVAGAAREAVASGAHIVIGPLFAADVPAVKAVAQEARIPVVALSSDTSLRERDVYVAGFSPEAQVLRIATYAIKRGNHHFAALVPATPYGSLVARTFQMVVSRMGGTVVALETYNPAARDSAAGVQTLARLKGQIDALFIPAGGDDLAMIAPQLVAAGFDATTTRFLGTGLWDDVGVGRVHPLLLGGWYAAPEPTARLSFTNNYKTTYGQDPVRLATLAYDMTALAAALSKHGVRNFDGAALTNPNGFAGLDGIFRLLRDGTVERGLAVNEVGSDGAVVIDAAPVTFAQ